MAQGSKTQTASRCWASVLRKTSPSPTHCSVKQVSTRQHGCTPDRSSGIWLTMPSVAAKTSVTLWSPERCGGQSVGLIITSLGLPCRCKLLQRVARLRNMKQLERSRMFAKDLDDRLTAHEPLSGPPPQQWEQFKTLVTESGQADHRAKDEIPSGLVRWGRRAHQRAPGRQEESLHRMAEWHLLHFKAWPLQTPPKAGRRMQDEWWEKKTNELETYAATKNSKMFFSASKEEVYGPTRPRTTPFLSADSSTMLKEKSSINARWREHFSTLLNRPSTVDCARSDPTESRDHQSFRLVPPWRPDGQRSRLFLLTTAQPIAWGLLSRLSPLDPVYDGQT